MTKAVCALLSAVYLFSAGLYFLEYSHGMVLAEDIEKEESIALPAEKPRSVSRKEWKDFKAAWKKMKTELDEQEAKAALKVETKKDKDGGEDGIKIPNKKPEGMSDSEWEKMKAKKPLPFDKGPSKIDVSKYPKDMQDIYNNVFLSTCSKCHTIARPINAPYALPAEWKKYIKKMMKKPGSGINPKKAKSIYKFLAYDSSIRKRDIIERKLANKNIIIMLDKQPDTMSDEVWEKLKTRWSKLKIRGAKL